MAALVSRRSRKDEETNFYPISRHDHYADPRTEVRVRAVVQSVSAIDTAHHAFSADVTLEATWLDTTAALQRRQQSFDSQKPLFEVLETGLNEGTLRDSTWSPGLYFSNALDAEVEEEWYRVQPDTGPGVPDGQVIIKQRKRIRSTFSEEFELEHFPVDKQDLKIKVRASRDVRMIHLAKGTSSRQRSHVLVDRFVNSSEWLLDDQLRLLVGETRASESLAKPPKVYSELHLQMRVVRKPGNYLIDVVLPLGLINLFSLSSLAVPRDSLGDRIAITLTMILTSITFKSIANATLPTLSYQTAMDWWVRVRIGVRVTVTLVA